MKAAPPTPGTAPAWPHLAAGDPERASGVTSSPVSSTPPETTRSGAAPSSPAECFRGPLPGVPTHRTAPRPRGRTGGEQGSRPRRGAAAWRRQRGGHGPAAQGEACVRAVRSGRAVRGGSPRHAGPAAGRARAERGCTGASAPEPPPEVVAGTTSGARRGGTAAGRGH